MLGCLIIGVFAGAVAFVLALLNGSSVWFALMLYSLVGAAATILVPLSLICLQQVLAAARTYLHRDRDEISEAPILAQELLDQVTQPDAVNRQIRILAVDDDPFILSLVSIISRNAGFSEVTSAGSGRHALRKLEESVEPFDCVLLDINMPEMDGIELCRRIREFAAYRSTPIIMLTAMRDIKSMDHALQAGANNYVTKPFDVIELGAHLQLIQESIGTVGSTPNAARLQQRTVEVGSQLQGTRIEEPSATRALDNLVEQEILAEHLGALSPAIAASTNVAAVKIDDVSALHAKTQAAQYKTMLNEIATVLEELFDAAGSMVAYVGGGTFLMATNCLMPNSAEVEAQINQRLSKSFGLARMTKSITVSVGKSVQPRGTCAQRSSSTFTRAIALANSRSLEKQGENQLDGYRLVS